MLISLELIYKKEERKDDCKHLNGLKDKLVDEFSTNKTSVSIEKEEKKDIPVLFKLKRQ